MLVSAKCVVKKVEPCGDHVRVELIDPAIEGKHENDGRPDVVLRLPVGVAGPRIRAKTLKVGAEFDVSVT